PQSPGCGVLPDPSALLSPPMLSSRNVVNATRFSAVPWAFSVPPLLTSSVRLCPGSNFTTVPAGIVSVAPDPTVREAPPATRYGRLNPCTLPHVPLLEIVPFTRTTWYRLPLRKLFPL